MRQFTFVVQYKTSSTVSADEVLEAIERGMEMLDGDLVYVYPAGKPVMVTVDFSEAYQYGRTAQ